MLHGIESRVGWADDEWIQHLSAYPSVGVTYYYTTHEPFKAPVLVHASLLALVLALGQLYQLLCVYVCTPNCQTRVWVAVTMEGSYFRRQPL